MEPWRTTSPRNGSSAASGGDLAPVSRLGTWRLPVHRGGRLGREREGYQRAARGTHRDLQGPRDKPRLEAGPDPVVPPVAAAAVVHQPRLVHVGEVVAGLGAL